MSAIYGFRRAIHDNPSKNRCLPALSQEAKYFSVDEMEAIDIEDIGIVGPGPDGVILPPETPLGDYRICTANSRPNICALVVMEEAPDPAISATTTQELFDTEFGTTEGLRRWAFRLRGDS